MLCFENSRIVSYIWCIPRKVADIIQYLVKYLLYSSSFLVHKYHLDLYRISNAIKYYYNCLADCPTSNVNHNLIILRSRYSVRDISASSVVYRSDQLSWMKLSETLSSRPGKTSWVKYQISILMSV